MKKSVFHSMFMCFALLFVFSECFSMEEGKKQIFPKGNSPRIEVSDGSVKAVASVFKTGMVCATVGGVIYHIANKYHEKPEIWGPALVISGAASAFLGLLGFGVWSMYKLEAARIRQFLPKNKKNCVSK